MAKSDTWYRMLKSEGSRAGIFVDMEDVAALETARTTLGGRDLRLSALYYEEPDPSSPCRGCLYFRTRSCSIDQVRRTGLGICQYVSEHLLVPEACLDMSLDVGDGDEHVARSHPSGRHAGHDTPAPAEIVIAISPDVFDPPPTTLTPVINYDLARQMRGKRIDVDVDVYARQQQFLPLAGSINSATGRYVTPVSTKDLMYLDVNGLLGLSSQSPADDSYAAARYVPTAATWFAEICRREEMRQKWQTYLRQILQREGWQISPCVRKFFWAELSEDEALEAFRILAQFYRFVNAADTETWHHLSRLERRHGIADRRQLRAIAAFGAENPGFVGCDHPLLQKFCPAARCRLADIYNEYVQPRLFT